jgi:dTDP-4-dehydrorhamnose reductase
VTAPILVTGGGQLATALDGAAAARGVALVRVARPAFDFDRPDMIGAAIERVAPSVIVNAAAYTRVDAAETDREAAWRANADGPRLLAEWTAARDMPLIHISTDYVFDGLKGLPYIETDTVLPQGVYAESKLAGERAALAANPRTIVLRTSWVYAATGHNFVRTMLALGATRCRLRVVADQKGCPTAAADLAEAILTIIAIWGRSGWSATDGGIYHAAGSGWTTWHGLAEAIFADAARLGRRAPAVEAITTADWPTPARRPPDSRLDCARLEARFGVRLPDWRASLARTITAIIGAKEQVRAGANSGG